MAANFTTFYNSDLAHIHDAGFGDFARKSGPGLLHILRKNRIVSGLIVDLGCGSGIWAEQIVASGYDVLGIDASRAMIKIAKKRVSGAEFQVGSIYKARIPPCAAVTSTGECLNYIAERTTALEPLFRRVYKSLKTGGLFIFDIAEPGQIPGGSKVRTFTEGDGWTVLVEKQEDPKTRILTRRIVAFVRSRGHFRRTEEMHRQKLYRSLDIAALLEKAGFKVRVLRSYGKFRLPPAHAAFAAQKSSS